MTSGSWTLPGFPDEVALGASSQRLWIAASTATLATEDVWFGQVTHAGIEGAVRVLETGSCCRPAIVALPHGALALACAPGRLVAAMRQFDTVSRWERALPGSPVHIAAVTLGDLVWIAVEVAHARERYLILSAVETATGEIIEEHRLGGGDSWCRWPALAADGRELVIAWCEGPAHAPGMIRVGRRTGRFDMREISGEPGEAPALAILPDGGIAVAWHHGGALAAGDDREASVVRMIEVAIVRLERNASIVATTPPPGAGGMTPRGEDQGWELPALAIDAAGALVLVGRSTHGHQIAHRGPDGVWSAPSALDGGGWGGRGRRHALVRFRDELWLARRAPDGIEIGPCPEPTRRSAPVRISRAASRRSSPPTLPGVLFGDLHQHTAHSDGCGSVEELWIAARDLRGLDFAAITDHDRFCRRAIGPATWQITTQIASSFDEPGRFAALAGYELTGARHPGPGHKCIYFGSRIPDRIPERDLEPLFALLGELGGIAVPHHVGWTGGDFAHHDPAIQPVWEICSVHGCYEAPGACSAHPPRADHVIPGQFIRDALDAGLRFGFIGSSDSHGLDWHHGIARWRNPFRSGLACVVGAEHSRDGIVAALRARRSYATSGAKIGVRAEVEGAALGSELPAGTRGELVVEVAPTAPVTRIALVHRAGEQLLDLAHHGPLICARTRLPEADAATYVYVRIEQEDGETAWVSPFWIG